jgi:membrane protease YdiL (CAAX protease family)
MRAFAWFVGAILLTGLIAALIGYPLYEASLSFASFAFHRVVSRIAMLVLLVLLFFLCRKFRLKSKADFGFGLPWRSFVATSCLWGAIGALSAAVGAAFLLGTHLRVPDPHFIFSAAGWARLLGIGLSSGIAVALLEDTVFRGGLHTAIERESGAWSAALLSAPLFAVLHLYAKARIPAEELSWHSGFDLIARSFAPLAQFGLIADTLISWMVVGLILSMTRVLTGNIAAAIGLHAGWVLVLRMLQEATLAGSSPRFSIWVGHFDGLLGYWLLPWGIVLAILMWLTRAFWAKNSG